MARLQWFKVDANLRHHPKAIVLADLLEDSRADLYLVDLWAWAVQNQPEGRISGSGAALVVERACRWMGPKGKLSAALVESGWLDGTPDGYEIHDWAEHAGAHIAKANKDTLAKREKRGAAQNGAERRELAQNGARQKAPKGANERRSLSPSPSTSQVGVRGKEPLAEALLAAFKAERGFDYVLTWDDENALREMARHDDAEVLRRWGIGLRWKGFPTCGSVCDLVNKWNHYGKEQEAQTKKADPRRDPLRAEDMDHSGPTGVVDDF